MSHFVEDLIKLLDCRIEYLKNLRDLGEADDYSLGKLFAFEQIRDVIDEAGK